MDEAQQRIRQACQNATARLSQEEISGSKETSSTPSRWSSSSSSPGDKLPASTRKMPADNPKDALHASLLTGKYSDLTIIHGEKKWKAHKIIVSSQSQVLAAKIEELKDSSTLDLTAHDQEAVGYAIEYLYTADYTAIDFNSGVSLARHITVFLLAISLGIYGLESVSATNYRHNLTNLITDLDLYFWSVVSIYKHTTTTHPGLRIVAAETAVMELPRLLEENTRARFMQITHEVPDFQADIYMILVLHPSRTLNIVPDLCDECGPRGADDSYSVEVECKGCGKEKVVSFS